MKATIENPVAFYDEQNFSQSLMELQELHKTLQQQETKANLEQT